MGTGNRTDKATGIETGTSAALEFEVTEADTAAAVGSGDVPVLATPRLLAWCEAATCAAVADSVGASRTSVGTRVSLEHLAASPVGQRLRVEASVVYVDPPVGSGGPVRLVRFAVAASHLPDGKVVVTGEVTRVVVDRGRFLARVGSAPAAPVSPAPEA